MEVELPGIFAKWENDLQLRCFKNTVKVNFFEGASLADTAGLLTMDWSLKITFLDFQKEDKFNKTALKAILVKAVAHTKQ